MEKVWDELKKIEAKAEQIRFEAQNNSTQITKIANEEAEKLVANAKSYAEQEAKQIQKREIEEANRRRDEQIKENKELSEKLRRQAERKMGEATRTIVTVVLGDRNVGSDYTVR